MVEEFSASGLGRREFCNGVASRSPHLTAGGGNYAPSLDWWLEEVARPESAAQSFTLRLANGRSIESSWQFNEEELARLIQIAERV